MAEISGDFRWSGVELRHLVALRAVAAAGSLAGAARRLGYSQPAVSQQLAALEKLLGVRLVDRKVGGRAVALTDEGQLVLHHARALIARAAAADADLRAMREGRSRRVRLGVIPSIGAHIVPTVLAHLMATDVDAQVDLIENADDKPLLEAVEGGRLDLAFAFAPVPEERFERVELLHDPYVLLARRDSAAARCQPPVSVEALESIDLLVCSQSDAVRRYCELRGVTPRIRYQIDDNATLVSLAAAGLGAALLPRLAIGRKPPELVELPLATPPPSRIVTLAWHLHRSLPLEASTVVEHVRAACDDIQAEWAGGGAAYANR